MKRFIKIIIFTFLLGYSFALTSKLALAKKKIGPAKTAVTTTSASIIISPRLRKDRKALLVTFSNLSKVSSFSYELTYLGSGIDQGVFGSVEPKGENSTSRELLFGTCSHNVCRYHAGIQDMRFVVTTKLKSGQTLTKKYRIKP